MLADGNLLLIVQADLAGLTSPNTPGSSISVVGNSNMTEKLLM